MFDFYDFSSVKISSFGASLLPGADRVVQTGACQQVRQFVTALIEVSYLNNTPRYDNGSISQREDVVHSQVTDFPFVPGHQLHYR